ncbi:hypothetical protein LXL04_012960 [Taraxacum kok-saghyz]
MGSRKLLPWLVMAMVFVGLAKGDFDKDQQECSDTLIGLATCLPYVSAQAKFPTMDCCYGLKQVVQKSKRCLCILIKDRDDPKLGLKINATLALGLPDSCHTPTNITECPKLMNLPPNSPDAKVFEDYGKNAKKNNITNVSQPGDTSNGNIEANDGGRGKNWLGVENICGGLYIIIMFLFQIA